VVPPEEIRHRVYENLKLMMLGRVKGVAEILGLKEYFDKNSSSLSKGDKQKN
jgi:energy-coupling factor transporter ATP-binding protein EcfA2